MDAGEKYKDGKNKGTDEQVRSFWRGRGMCLDWMLSAAMLEVLTSCHRGRLVGNLCHRLFTSCVSVSELRVPNNHLKRVRCIYSSYCIWITGSFDAKHQ